MPIGLLVEGVEHGIDISIAELGHGALYGQIVQFGQFDVRIDLKGCDVFQLLAMLDGFPQEVLTANYEYYEPRTEHGSSLSPSVHALVACKAEHHQEAYRYFMESATIDLYNVLNYKVFESSR